MTDAFRVVGRGAIDPHQKLSFTFDGVVYEGLAGDTLASALLANGVRLIGRSFKYHRPRGLLSAGVDEPNGLVSVDRGGGRVTPNLRATVVELYEGLSARSQNRWPSLAIDIAEIADLAAPLIPAGFYYKTFMRPRGAWRHFYEPLIRAAAGLGEAPTEPDPDRYAMRFSHCETLVVGAGPAGIVAAIIAAQAGERVILCDENKGIGGRLRDVQNVQVEGLTASEWLNRADSEIAGCANLRVLTRTTAFGVYSQNMVGLAERRTDHLLPKEACGARETYWRVRAKKIIIATGAHERPLVFSNNDRPGVMLASAARAYLNRYGVLVGRSPLVATADDEAYFAAFELADAGAPPKVIVDLRAVVAAPILEAARSRGIETIVGGAVLNVAGSRGVRAADIADASGRRMRIACDAVLMSAGWTPSLHLFSHARGALRWDANSNAFLPADSMEKVLCAGSCNGTRTIDAAIMQGRRAGEWAINTESRAPQQSFGAESAPRELIVEGQGAHRSKKRAFVDFQHDVTTKDIRLAVREGFRSIEHIKRYTTTGMATDQGKTSNLNALAIASEALGTTIPQMGLTTFRPPYTPVTFGAIAGYARGELFDPVRRAPLYDWAEEEGAVFEDAGQWRRARYFPRGEEDMHAAVARECAAVRNSAGIFDASTLGKIEVVGPDAGVFLDRMYTSAWTKLAVGKCKYGLLLREDGFVFDDGVIARISEDRFHVTTTTGGAARVLAHMEDYLQTEFPEMKAWLTSTTEQWAVIALNGPNSRRIIESLVDDIDLSTDVFPHMSVREGRIAGVPTRLFRVSFTGELGYEINVPARHARGVWEAIFARGGAYAIVPYGTETMHVLRAEKGYVIVGQETDGTVTPDDVGLGWTIAKSKPDFVGKRSLARPDMLARGRRQLVGLLTVDGDLLEEGAQLVRDSGEVRPSVSIGRVSSSYFSAALGRPIALALLADGRNRTGEAVYVTTKAGFAKAQVTAPVFYDPQGARLNV